jgi:hypothetical protein
LAGLAISLAVVWRWPRGNLTSLAAEAVAEQLGLFDHAQKSCWVTLQAGGRTGS